MNVSNKEYFSTSLVRLLLFPVDVKRCQGVYRGPSLVEFPARGFQCSLLNLFINAHFYPIDFTQLTVSNCVNHYLVLFNVSYFGFYLISLFCCVSLKSYYDDYYHDSWMRTQLGKNRNAQRKLKEKEEMKLTLMLFISDAVNRHLFCVIGINNRKGIDRGARTCNKATKIAFSFPLRQPRREILWAND